MGSRERSGVPRHADCTALPGMRIAQIAPPAERVASYLTEELLRLGHDATLFASGDPARSLERVRSHAHEFDVLHFHHLDAPHFPPHFPLLNGFANRTLTTLHGRPDCPGLAPLLHEFRNMPLAAVSHSQRAALPAANWLATVHHGLPAEICPLNPVAPRGAGRYLAFLGREAPEDGLERARQIAQLGGLRLRVAGEVGESAKPAYLGNASALLYPIERPEPFGLAMIEAMSCGTPVIGWRRGAVPEVIDAGVTGFVVDSVEQAVAALPAALRLDRTRVRERFEQRFSARRMAHEYLALYRSIGRRAVL